MEARTSPRRRTPSRRLVSASATDRVDKGRVTKTTPTPHRAAEAVSTGSNWLRTVTASSQNPKGRRTGTAPSTVRTAKDSTITALSTAKSINLPSLVSGPSQASSKLSVKRTRPAASSSRDKRQIFSPLSPDEDYDALTVKSGASLISPEMRKLLDRGSVISPTNAMQVMVREEMRPNPFFETMPAPVVIRQGAPRLFLAGETTAMHQYIGQQVKFELLKEGEWDRFEPVLNTDPCAEESSQKTLTKQSPGFLSRFFDQATATLGFGKSRKGGDDVLRVKLPQPWDLPRIDEAEVIRLVQTLPRNAARVNRAKR